MNKADVESAAKRADDYVQRIIAAHPRNFPEWSAFDVGNAWFEGYATRDAEIQELKAKIRELEGQLNK